jgi:hypothetical protein
MHKRVGSCRAKVKKSFLVHVTLALSIVLATMADPFSARASLGGDVTSVHGDQAKLQASLQTMSKDLYSVHEMRAPNGVVVREYVTPAGRVFGVAWQGPTRPDMRQVLGPYFDPFIEGAQAQRAQHIMMRGPLTVQLPGLVVEMDGHARAFFGRAYVPQMVPAGVRAEELR